LRQRYHPILIIKQKLRQVSTIFLFLIFILIQFACPNPPEDKPPPEPPQNNSINLSLISANTYTAQFRVSAGDTLVDWMYSLQRNGEEILSAIVFSSDTMFTDSNLTANTEYIYKAFMQDEDEKVDSTASVTINTLEEIINLELISTFTTTSRFRISIPDSTIAWSFDLYRDGFNVFSTNVYQKDSVIIDGGLSPNTQYSYQAVWIYENSAIDTSENVIAQTMDTTSHNFVWEIDTLGGYNSVIFDVNIVDENNIWVVGMIKIPDPDSSFNGTGWESFNAAHWDGNDWELLRLEYSDYGEAIEGIAIIAFSENDILVSAGTLFDWDGNEWNRWDIEIGTFPGGINTFWGTSSSNLYFVGRDGSIVHYDGSTFTEMESDTEVDLEDIDGTEDGQHVFVSGFNSSGYNNTSPLFHIHNGEVTKEYESTYPWGNETDWGRIEALEVIGDTAYLSTWGRDWIAYNYLTDEYIEHNYNTIPEFYGTRVVDISSNGINDITCIDATGEIIHFNGLNWKKNIEIHQTFSGALSVKKSKMKDDLVVFVGRNGAWINGIVVRGKRTN
jgi:chitodextrinase